MQSTEILEVEEYENVIESFIRYCDFIKSIYPSNPFPPPSYSAFSDIQMRATARALLSPNDQEMESEHKLFLAVAKNDDVKCMDILDSDPHLLTSRTIKKALHLALKNRHKKVASIFVDKMTPQEAYDTNNSSSAVELAIISGYHDLVEHMLVSAPWKSLAQWKQQELLESSSIVYDAISTRDIGMLKIVLDNMPALMESINQYRYEFSKRRPLSYAIHKGYYKEVCYMLEKFPSSAINDPSPVIHTALKGGHLDIIKELLNRFPEFMNHCNENKQMPLSYASYKGDINMVRYFLNNFLKYATISNEDGTYPIHEAVALGHVEVVKEFITCCPETMFQVDAKGRSILHIVVECEKSNVFSYLKENAEIKRIYHLKDKNGNTFVDLATQIMKKRHFSIQSHSNKQPKQVVSNGGTSSSSKLPKYDNGGVFSFRFNKT